MVEPESTTTTETEKTETNSETTTTVTDEALQLQNYQRRSPLPGVIIQRILRKEDVLRGGGGGGGTGDCDLDNILRIIKEGEETNNKALLTERNKLLLP